MQTELEQLVAALARLTQLEAAWPGYARRATPISPAGADALQGMAAEMKELLQRVGRLYPAVVECYASAHHVTCVRDVLAHTPLPTPCGFPAGPLAAAGYGQAPGAAYRQRVRRFVEGSPQAEKTLDEIGAEWERAAAPMQQELDRVRHALGAGTPAAGRRDALCAAGARALGWVCVAAGMLAEEWPVAAAGVSLVCDPGLEGG